MEPNISRMKLALIYYSLHICPNGVELKRTVSALHATVYIAQLGHMCRRCLHIFRPFRISQWDIYYVICCRWRDLSTHLWKERHDELSCDSKTPCGSLVEFLCWQGNICTSFNTRSSFRLSVDRSETGAHVFWIMSKFAAVVQAGYPRCKSSYCERWCYGTRVPQSFYLCRWLVLLILLARIICTQSPVTWFASYSFSFCYVVSHHDTLSLVTPRDAKKFDEF